jgi:hypothetical protein
MVVITYLTADHLAEQLARLEQAHQMSSAEFFARFRLGDLPLRRDFVRWQWLCIVAQRRGLLTIQ